MFIIAHDSSGVDLARSPSCPRFILGSRARLTYHHGRHTGATSSWRVRSWRPRNAYRGSPSTSEVGGTIRARTMEQEEEETLRDGSDMSPWTLTATEPLVGSRQDIRPSCAVMACKTRARPYLEYEIKEGQHPSRFRVGGIGSMSAFMDCV